MRGNMRANVLLKHKYKIWPMFVALAVILSSCAMRTSANAADCKDLRIVFARGSGEERNTNANYTAFKNALETKLQTTSLSYEFIDLDYPAIGVDNFGVLMGAFFSAGDAYEFGGSVETGYNKLVKMVGRNTCPNTKYILGGYSQGAMVVSKSLSQIDPDKVIFAATFGDPKLYLPEGEGLIPAACKGQNLSDYRVYVPDCQAYKGILGAYIPYEPASFAGKVGTWCNKRDIMCSSRISISDHTSYVSEDLYEDASRTIFTKITDYYGIENTAFSPHDTAFLIDSTGSMNKIIEVYREEVFEMAKATLESGGRVALFDYRDLEFGYEPVEHCNFETCTLEVFENELYSIETEGGGDEPESMLSASLHAMNTLDWKFGATKSIVIVTDIYYLEPDRDGTVLDDVVKLSKRIDPVHFYLATDVDERERLTPLAEGTDGEVVTSLKRLHSLIDEIIQMDDGLPKVIERDESEIITKPTLEVLNYEASDGEIILDVSGDMTSTIVVLNNSILGATNENRIIISDIDTGVQNTVTLVPINDEIKGEAKEIVFSSDTLPSGHGGSSDSSETIESDGTDTSNEAKVTNEEDVPDGIDQSSDNNIHYEDNQSKEPVQPSSNDGAAESSVDGYGGAETVKQSEPRHDLRADNFKIVVQESQNLLAIPKAPDTGVVN